MTGVVLAVFLAFFAAQLLVESGLALANLRHVERAGDAVPPPLAGLLDTEAARRSRVYTVARGRFGLVHAAWAPR